MQKVIRRTALARNQAQRKAAIAANKAERFDTTEHHKQRINYERQRNEQVKAERHRRREDWMRGPLAPQWDAGPEGKYFGAVKPHNLQFPPVAKHMRRQFINIAPGDRVCILKGRDKGKIGEVSRVDAETESLEVKDHNMAEAHFPDFLSQQYNLSSNITAIHLPFKIDDVRLVVALDDPATGQTRDVIVDHVHGGGPILDRGYNSSTPKHTRYISGEDIEIPWPSSEPPRFEDQDGDTLRMEVETPTWVPSLHAAPFPPSVLDELRNKFSKYRTRHDPEWVEAKKMEDYRREYLETRSLLTPKGELKALQQARRKAQLEARKDADGNYIMGKQTVNFIEQFMKEKAAKRA